MLDPALLADFGGPDPEPEELRREGLGWVYEPKEHGVRLTCDFIERKGFDIEGEIRAYVNMPGLPRGHIHKSRLSLGKGPPQQAFARRCREISRSGDSIPWDDLIEAFCTAVVDEERDGEPTINLAHLTPRPELLADQIEHFLPYGGMTLLYAPGGSGKGFTAIYAALCVATGLPFLGRKVRQGNVLYADWEDSDQRTLQRYQAVLRGMVDVEVTPDFHYKHFVGPLAGQIHSIARDCDRLNIDLVVVDSAQWATGTSSGDGASSQVDAFVNAIRYLQRTVLVIDHVNKATMEADQSRPGLPIGYIQKYNAARAAFELKRDQEPESSVSRIGLYDRKENHSIHRRPVGIRIEWSEEGKVVRFYKDDISDSPVLAATLPLKDRITTLLRHGAKTSEDIASELGCERDEVKLCLGRYKGKAFIAVGGGWALLSSF